MSEPKRYIVTYENESITEAGAAKVLGVAKNKLQEGVSLLSTADVLDAGDVLHFSEIGSSVATLTDKRADDLRSRAGVAEVVEDFEVFALGCECSQGEDGEVTSSMPIATDERSCKYPTAYWADDDAPDSSELADLPQANRACRPGERRVCVRLAPWIPPICFCLPARRPTPGPVLPPPTPAEWNIRMVGAERVWHRTTGRGVKVAVLDTGIDDNHPDLTVSGGVSVVPGVSHWNDDQGHGTHCAGTIGARRNAFGVVGVAPESSLYAVKVLDRNGSGRLSWILAGMGWAAQQRMNVVSMSLGSNVSTANAACVMAYQRAAERLANAGCIVVAAAGNAGRRPNHWVGNPARCPGFMAVAAVDRNGRIADFSSHGPPSLPRDRGVEIAAPGVQVRSTTRGGAYGPMSGTSMACPHVAGAAALLKELRPTWSPQQIRSRLRSTARDLGAPGNDEFFGAGLLDCRKAVFG